ncbi:MAG: YheC/YheD family protein [Candidatus Saccharibacteria bacterium]
MRKKQQTIPYYPKNAHKTLIGVLSCPVRNSKKSPRTVKLNNYKELVILSQDNNVTAFVFMPESVDWKRKRIVGSTIIKKSSLDKGSDWQVFRFPLPDVVYNRVPNRRTESKKNVQDLKQRLSNEAGIPFFNPMFLDKWDVYIWLKDNPELSQYIPETHLMDRQTLERMLDKYDSVYVKPRAGSLGRGIMRIERIKKLYRYNTLRTSGYKNGSRVRKKRVIDLAMILKGKQEFMVQQGINLARYQGRIFDIRALVQKDYQGQWHLSGMAARVASPNAHVTHLPNGGRPVALFEALSGLTDSIDERQKIMAKLASFAEAIPPALEKGCKKQFGEISLDIGIDQKWNIWLIEANSKPFKFDERNIRILSRLRIIEYATYLSSLKDKRS